MKLNPTHWQAPPGFVNVTLFAPAAMVPVRHVPPQAALAFVTP
jgi:hypothetical protein